MAFIRSYAAMSGDPFKLRMPKFIRKLQPGKLLKKAVNIAAPFIPGVGGVAARLLASRNGSAGVMAAPSIWDQIGARFGMTGDDVLSFARGYGWAVGDPAPRTKRKAAASGTKAKAAAKREKRGGGKRPAKSSARKVDMVGLLEKGAEAAGPLAELATELTKRFGPPGVGPSAAIAMGMGPVALPSGGRALGGFGRRRRSMNPTNVKALRRSMRRVEGFQKTVARVNRMFPKLRAATSGGGRSRGHRAGCRCAVCKRAA